MHVMNSQYCFPKSSHEMVLRFRCAKDDLKSVSVLYESKYTFAKKQKSALMEKTYTTELFDFYEITLDLKDTRLAYIFIIESDEGKFYYSEEGVVTNYDFDLCYYDFFQYPYINEADVVNRIPWMENAIFYQIFVDRFNIGKEDKDTSYINSKWGNNPDPWCFMGGDLPGITKKLEYIKELGVNSIYLTPIFESHSNHKYDIIDYYKVDSRIGTNKDLKELVSKAHKMGIRIVLDAVFNHISNDSSQFLDVCEKGKDSPYYNWFFVYEDKPSLDKVNYETFASVKYMPKLNTSNPDVCKFLCDIGAYYIKEYDIDGWRLDVADEISYEFWRQFRKAVKNAKSDAVLIGENWHDAYSNLCGEQYDSIMNYAFTKVCIDYFSGKKNAKQASDKLNEILMRNKEGINRMLLNLLDSHDTMRFFTLLNKRRSSMKSALSLLYFYMGAPCIFYGTEILTQGNGDPDCRKCMDWDKAESKEFEDIYSLLRKLSDIRKEPGFVESDIRITYENDVLVLKRSKGYALYINEEDSEKTVDKMLIPSKGFLMTKNEKEYLKSV